MFAALTAPSYRRSTSCSASMAAVYTKPFKVAIERLPVSHAPAHRPDGPPRTAGPLDGPSSESSTSQCSRHPDGVSSSDRSRSHAEEKEGNRRMHDAARLGSPERGAARIQGPGAL